MHCVASMLMNEGHLSVDEFRRAIEGASLPSSMQR